MKHDLIFQSEHHGRFVIGEKDVPEQPHARQSECSNFSFISETLYKEQTS